MSVFRNLRRWWKGLGAITALGVLLLFANRPADAGSSNSFAITILIPDGDAPAAVPDLSASSGSEGQAILKWTSPDQNHLIPSGSPVTSYDVRMATFSVPVAGSTTAWWSGAQSLANAP